MPWALFAVAVICTAYSFFMISQRQEGAGIATGTVSCVLWILTFLAWAVKFIVEAF